jgi:small GTP-binding protein
MMVVKKKICMIGPPGVGKTSLVRRFVYDLFEDKYLTTLGVKVSQRLCPPVETPNHQMVEYTLLLWDIEGTEKIRPAVRNYYMGASGALMVMDLARRETIDVVLEVMKEFKTISPDANIILAGNKIDLVDVDDESVKALAEVAGETGLHCFLTSAKTGQNVESAFQKFCELFSWKLT